MNSLVLGLAAALALLPRAARADDDQTTIISAQGDARARAVSPEAMVSTKPALPPNSAPSVVPSPSIPTAVAAPSAVRPAVVPAAPTVASSPQAPPAVSGTLSTPKSAPHAETSEPMKGRNVLIAVGALLALAMFLWERRGKD